MGCGLNKVDGFVNVDKFAECHPDVQMDLEALPWSFGDNEADEVLFHHSLEHIGADPKIFLGMMKELYRVSKPDAKIQINVPHPRHDNFIGDPTHVRIISPQVLSLFSKKNNQYWQKIGAPNSQLALYLDVDFEIVRAEQVVERAYMERLQKKEISEQELMAFINERNNVVAEYKITLRVVK
jgi:ubiquinone/menaquinone biosynthesis C-methylase UbiE